MILDWHTISAMQRCIVSHITPNKIPHHRSGFCKQYNMTKCAARRMHYNPHKAMKPLCNLLQASAAECALFLLSCLQYLKSVYHKNVCVWQGSKKEHSMTTGEWRALDSIADLPESPNDVESQRRKDRGKFGEERGAVGDNAAITKDSYGASWWQQFLILSRRSLKARRFEAISPQDITLIMTIGCFTGCRLHPSVCLPPSVINCP